MWWRGGERDSVYALLAPSGVHGRLLLGTHPPILMKQKAGVASPQDYGPLRPHLVSTTASSLVEWPQSP